MVGRIVGGFGIGASAIAVPAYLAELAPSAHRGAIVQVYEVMLCLGMISAMVMDWALSGPGWRWMVVIPSIPGSVMALSLLLLPESPRWLVMRGRLDEALQILRLVSGSDKVCGGRKYHCDEVSR